MYDSNYVPDEFIKINNDRNKVLWEMNKHVREWIVQKNLLKKRSRYAKDDLVKDVVWGERRYVFVVDYTQNMGLSHHGNEKNRRNILLLTTQC